MRTAEECLSKALEMERRAADTLSADRDEWIAMAQQWRDLANEALWQDRCGVMTGRHDIP